jgi:hypothetical protein
MDESTRQSEIEHSAARHAGYLLAAHIVGMVIGDAAVSQSSVGICRWWPDPVNQANELDPDADHFCDLLTVFVSILSSLSEAFACEYADIHQNNLNEYYEYEVCGTLLGYHSFDSDAIDEYEAEGIDYSNFIAWDELLPRVEELRSKLVRIAEQIMDQPQFRNVLTSMTDFLVTRTKLTAQAARAVLHEIVDEQTRVMWDQAIRKEVLPLLDYMAENAHIP